VATSESIANLCRLVVSVALVLATVQSLPVAASGSEPRTVIVIAGQDPPRSSTVQSRLCTASARCDNGRDGIIVVELLTGTLPAVPVLARVLTDTNCAPDRYGISHCRNTLQLRAGSRLAVRHSHNMSTYPCLTPGETVRVTTSH
jgi:hypothetical protein